LNDLPLTSVSVVICAYTLERWHLLLRAIRSLERQTVAPCEVIVAIDHNDALRERLARERRDVLVVQNRDAPGLSGARNAGVSVATGEIVAFLDDDAVAAPDWIEQLLNGYTNPSVIGVGGSIEPLWDEQRPRGFPPEFDWVVGCTYRGMPDRASSVRNLIGANMSFRRAVLTQVGQFPTGIGRVGTRPVGCEETEFCIRALRASPNSILLYEPAARVLHRVPPNRAGWSYFSSRCYSEGLSKAAVVRRTGIRRGLASERAHAAKQLPRAFVRGLADAVRGDRFGAVRAAAVAFGLAMTIAGFVVGTLVVHLTPSPSSS
jgi:GT2 family glycosyltransferase